MPKNIYNCRICNAEYEYCHSCAITKDIFRNAGYCGKNCYDISMLIQQYRGNTIDAESAMKSLNDCGADKVNLVPGVAKYYEEIKEKAIPKIETVKDTEPKETSSYFNKRNKFKNKIEESLPIEENTSGLTDEDTESLDK